jgi:hypothetical protein
VALRAGEPVPASVTIDIPLAPNFADDHSVSRRVVGALYKQGIDASGYLAVLYALADRPLAQTRMQSWFGYLPGTEPRADLSFSIEVEDEDGGGGGGGPR